MVSVRTAACDQLFQICPGVRGELHGVGSSTFFSPGLPRGNLMFDLPIGQHSSLPALVAEGDESGDERRGNARVCRNVLARIIHDFQKRWSQAVAVSRLTQSRAATAGWSAGVSDDPYAHRCATYTHPACG